MKQVLYILIYIGLALMTACTKPDRDDEAVALSTKIVSEGLSDANHALERVDSAEQAGVFTAVRANTIKASDKKDLKKALFYIDELMRAEKIGMDVNKDYVLTCGMMGAVFNLMKGDAAKALCYMLDMRKLAADDKKEGIDYSNPMTVILYENLLSEYRKTFGDKLTELTLYGKKYVIIAKGSWNVEMPLMGWLGGLSDDGGDKANELHTECSR